VNLPVEIWQPIASGKTLDYIAQRGIKGMIHLTGEKLTDQMFHSYQESAAKAGRQLTLGQDLALGMGFYIADTQETAIENARPYHDERYKWFAPFGFVRYTDSEGRPWGTPGAPARVPSLEDGVEQKVWSCGPAESFVEMLRDYEEKYPGMEDVVLHWPEGMPWLEFKDQLTLFAERVMPAFAGQE
ncbi:MAG TPA: LLM class flavin-dependent oxidoreductase, partial [Dehalococcoidia bacterium]|nr:LLM class flavin-dependent oxidoreductase [Dehalococcoidia bacterium]